MPQSDDQLRIYEGSSITVTGEVEARHAELVEEVTFKFFIDGEKSEEKTVSMRSGTKDGKTGNASVTHTLRAAVVPDDKDSYTLDYHVFYKVKHEDGTTETQENLAVSKFEVVPRTAQLAVTHVKDGKPITNFQFKVFQGGEQVGGLQSTFAEDTQNAKGEPIPAGTAEFNLGLAPGFRIVQAAPYEISEETVAKGRKRSLKGEVKFRAVFVAPKRGTVRQLVNLDVADEGRTGEGRDVTIGVAPEGDEDRAVRIASESTEVHFRVTYGPESGEVTKSKRDDAAGPTKVTGDASATIEEKTAKTKYQGKVTLGGGVGYFKVGLGAAGGDTCRVEIAGSDKFLNDTSVGADQTLSFENWRRVYYELMVPDVMAQRVLDADGTLGGVARKKLESLGKQLFIEFVPDGATVFDVTEHAQPDTLVRPHFLELAGPKDSVAYVLTGRNWRDLPKQQVWPENHPGRTLSLSPCDALLKWCKDTADPQAATKDYSTTLTAATGSIEIEKTFGGLFMPFSGDDGGDGITDIEWTADISASDSCVKYMPVLEIEEVRGAQAAQAGQLEVRLTPADGAFPATPVTITFSGAGDKFDATLFEAAVPVIETLVDELLCDHEVLVAAQAKVKVAVAGPADNGHGEGACFDAVKAKLTECFDAKKKEIVRHPGLDPDGNPRSGSMALWDFSDTEKSTIRTWYYELPEVQADHALGPGAFVGAAKSAEQCPIKLELSAKPHKAEPGSADGHLVTWVVDPAASAKNLVRFVLQAFGAIKDKAALQHGHGADGKPGDCLATADRVCPDCVAFARSVSLERIP